MGKIQSAITGAVMSTLGAITAQNKMEEMKNNKALATEKAASEEAQAKKAQAEKAEVDKIKGEGSQLYANTFSGANAEEQSNLIERQQEAIAISQEYVKSRMFQKNAFKEKLNSLASKNAEIQTKKLYQSKMDELKKKKEEKGGKK